MRQNVRWLLGMLILTSLAAWWWDLASSTHRPHREGKSLPAISSLAAGTLNAQQVEHRVIERGVAGHKCALEGVSLGDTRDRVVSALGRPGKASLYKYRLPAKSLHELEYPGLLVCLGEPEKQVRLVAGTPIDSIPDRRLALAIDGQVVLTSGDPWTDTQLRQSLGQPAEFQASPEAGAEGQGTEGRAAWYTYILHRDSSRIDRLRIALGARDGTIHNLMLFRTAVGARNPEILDMVNLERIIEEP